MFIRKILFTAFVIYFNCNFIFANSELERAKDLFKVNQFEESKTILELLVEAEERNAEAHYYLGRTNMALGEFEDASENFESAVELENNNADYHFWLGQAYGRDAQESNIFSAAALAPKIKTAFENTVKYDSMHVGGHIGLANFYANAPGIMGGDIDEAIKEAKIAVKLDEKQGRFLLARLLTAEDVLDSAEVQYKLLEEKFGDDKDFSNLYNIYGYFLLNQARNLEAIEKFKKQVLLAPDNANSYDSLGDGYRAAGKLEAAAEQYRKALKVNPEFEASRNNLEDVLEEIEDQK